MTAEVPRLGDGMPLGHLYREQPRSISPASSRPGRTTVASPHPAPKDRTVALPDNDSTLLRHLYVEGLNPSAIAAKYKATDRDIADRLRRMASSSTPSGRATSPNSWTPSPRTSTRRPTPTPSFSVHTAADGTRTAFTSAVASTTTRSVGSSQTPDAVAPPVGATSSCRSPLLRTGPRPAPPRGRRPRAKRRACAMEFGVLGDGRRNGQAERAAEAEGGS